MKEEQWLSSADPYRMLDFVNGKVSDRKLRLFAIACCRRTWPLLGEASRRVVEMADAYVEGLVTAAELGPVVEEAGAISNGLDPGYDPYAENWDEWALTQAAHGAWWPALTERVTPEFIARTAADSAATALGIHLVLQGRTPESLGLLDHGNAEVDAAVAQEKMVQADMLRCCIGPRLFRTWGVDFHALGRSIAVHSLAAAIYSERAWDRLPVLADALEEAGVTDADILAHCRGPGPHVRGCWVVDLVLGKA